MLQIYLSTLSTLSTLYSTWAYTFSLYENNPKTVTQDDKIPKHVGFSFTQPFSLDLILKLIHLCLESKIYYISLYDRQGILKNEWLQHLMTQCQGLYIHFYKNAKEIVGGNTDCPRDWNTIPLHVQLLDYTDSKPLLGRLAKSWASESMAQSETNQVSVDEKEIESLLNQNLCRFPLQELLFLFDQHPVLNGYPPQLLDSTEIYVAPQYKTNLELEFKKGLGTFASSTQRHGL